jgi:uncharacterized protein YceH (UPF0502 family)
MAKVFKCHRCDAPMEPYEFGPCALCKRKDSQDRRDWLENADGAELARVIVELEEKVADLEERLERLETKDGET